MKKTKPNIVHSRDGGETIDEAEFDRRFEAGEDITGFMAVDQASRPGRATQRVNVDLPIGFLGEIDQEARRIGVPRQAWIKMALAGVLKQH
jgi:predicted DNA binding CopG/RHH family protein